MAERLSRDVFIALAAIGWADGSLDAEEADGIVRAALECGLELEDITQIEEATKKPVDLTTLDRAKMSVVERTFVYATAVWLARLDGTVDPAERQALHKLGDLLNMPDRVRTQASAAALEIAQLPSGDRPDRYDFNRLRERLEEKLQSREM
jgi:uncharacterized membrane protein YebE (DUF533 family)